MTTTRRFNKSFPSVLLGLCFCLLIMQSVDAQSINFDHFSTNFPLTGVHQTVSCERCHVNGIFKGAPRSCNGCHNGSIAMGKPVTHVSTTNACADCHGTSTWPSVIKMNH